MNVSKDECYQNTKVCFDLDFIAKNNVFLVIIIIIIMIIIKIIIITLFQEDNIFGKVSSLTYGPQLTNVGMIL